MSHASGITVTKELGEFFSETHHKNDKRLLKVVIEDEKLKLATSKNIEGAWDEDYDKFILPLLEEKAACYILYRLDTKNDNGFQWILICYVPDFAPVRAKMVYASTRAELRSQFGDYRIKDEVFGTVAKDVSMTGYIAHMKAEGAAAPLTMAEIEKLEIRLKETGVDISTSSKRSHMGGVSFPLTHDALAKLKDLKAGSVSFVQLAINIEKEEIYLVQADNTDADGLSAKVSNDSPRYNFIVYRHEYEGEQLDSIVFVYSCPGYKCAVKERMLYASGKGPVLSVAEEDVGLTIAKKIEVSDPSELSANMLYNEIHPPKVEVNARITRPQKPGKGGRQLTKA
eukprot:Colp12_sorted_trinity150504_noHs@9260